MVTATSIQSYYDHVIEGKATSQRERIFLLLKKYHPLSRRLISEITCIPINAVCGRVNALIDDGKVEVTHVEKDTVTKRRVEYLAPVTEKPTQQFLF